MDKDHSTPKQDEISSITDIGSYLSKLNNSRNNRYFTDVPQICKDEACMLGIDEAGRGPVLGPMVYGLAYCPLQSEELIRQLKCDDSKELTEETRNSIFNNMNSIGEAKQSIGWSVDIISPNTISTNMLRRTKHSLNEISMDAAIGLIERAIEMEVNIAEIYVDTVGPPEKYQEKLLKLFPDFNIIVAKKADSTYPIVSAASIFAKVIRDHALHHWKFPEGSEFDNVKFGSGYPNDPVTKSFLKDHCSGVFGYPRLIRFSWSTASNALLAGKAHPLEFEDINNTEKDQQNAPSITKYFQSASKPKREHSRYYTERYLSTDFDF